MKGIQTDITKVIEIQCTVYGDERGFFKEVIHPDKLAEFGINHRFVQLNHSKSQQGILSVATIWPSQISKGSIG